MKCSHLTICAAHPSKRTWNLIGSLILIGSFLLIHLGQGWAESGHGKHQHDPKAKLEKMTKSLSLTEDQRNKILPILEEKHQKMQALHEQMKETRQQAIEKVEAVLNPDQREKYKQRREARQKKMKEYREKRGKGKHRRGHDED